MKNKNKKNLLVTLADESYFEQAKQLFSSVYWNAGWKGDYMLLAHEIPEKKLKWFRDKGILVKKCKPLMTFEILKVRNWHPVFFSKFYLFTPEFKKWRNIIFLDSDIIVRASLDELTNVVGFAAIGNVKLLRHFHMGHSKVVGRNKKLFDTIKRNYDLNKVAFNSGVLAFPSSIIKKDTFLNLKKLLNQYLGIICEKDETILNLYFYRNWKKLSQVYNVCPNRLIHLNRMKSDKINGVILHFQDHKSWNLWNYFYKEWKINLERAESIDLREIPPARKIWTEKEILDMERFIEESYSKFWHDLWKINGFIDKHLGAVGVSLGKKHPWLYFKLKRFKKERTC